MTTRRSAQRRILDHHPGQRDRRPYAIGRLTTAVGEAGGIVTALDVVDSDPTRLVADLTCDTADAAHAAQVTQALEDLDGVEVRKVSDRTFLLHLGGKIEVTPKVALRNRDELSRAYTPGVARVCLAIAENPDDARRLTIKRNTVAVVTDGSAVLGLGNLGPAAALPVMEGKAALFKRFGGVDAWPVVLDTQDTDEIVRSCAPSRRRTAASTWRTSRRRAASRSRPGCATCSTSRSSTTTSTAPRSACSPRSPTRCGSSARRWPTYGWWSPAPAPPARRSSSCCCARASATSSPTTGRARCTGPARPQPSLAVAGREHQPRRLRRRPARRAARRRRLHRRLRAEPAHRRRHRRDGTGRDRVRAGQPRPRGRPAGGPQARRDRRHRPVRPAQPDQQRARLPRRLPRHARRRRHSFTEEMALAAASAIADAVGLDKINPSVIVPSVFDPRSPRPSPRRSGRWPGPRGQLAPGAGSAPSRRFWP